jgi:hypothetical protein
MPRGPKIPVISHAGKEEPALPDVRLEPSDAVGFGMLASLFCLEFLYREPIVLPCHQVLHDF